MKLVQDATYDQIEILSDCVLLAAPGLWDAVTVPTGNTFAASSTYLTVGDKSTHIGSKLDWRLDPKTNEGGGHAHPTGVTATNVVSVLCSYRSVPDATTNEEQYWFFTGDSPYYRYAPVANAFLGLRPNNSWDVVKIPRVRLSR